MMIRRVMARAGVALLLAASASGQTLPGTAEAISFLGDTLHRPALSPDAAGRLMAQLEAAEEAHRRNPGSADATIWLGRRAAYVGRYRDAIAVFSEGLAAHPSDPRFYRHRGHRYITTRRLDRAISDLLYAAQLTRGKPDQVEPDGQPNARNIPLSTLQSNIWYHLALAYYLKGDFRRAAGAWREDLRLAKNDDSRMAARYWLYLTLRRMGRAAEAGAALEPVRPGMEIIENTAYYRLLLLFAGRAGADSLPVSGNGDAALQDATVGYGLGAWHWINGRRAEAMDIWRRIVATGPWASFGFIAAEAELARQSSRGGSP